MKLSPQRIIACLLICAPILTAHAAGWTSPVAVSPTGNPDPTRGAQVNSIDVNSSGRALASWDQYFYTNGGGSTVGVNVQDRGRWGTPITLSDPAKFSDRAKTAVGADGTMVVAWASETPSGRTIEASVWPAGGSGWSAPVVLGSGYTRVSPDPSNVKVAVNASGEVWVVWSIHDNAHYVVEAAYRNPGTGSVFSSPIPVSIDGEDAMQPALALNDIGEVAIAWAGSPYAMNTSPNTITVVKSTGGAAFGAPIRVAPELSPYSGYQTWPSICLDGSGLATVTWMGAGMQANLETAPGVWKGAESILPPVSSMTSFISPSLACNDQGSAIVSAALFDATVGVQRAQLWTATLSGDIWSAPVQLTGLSPRKTEDIGTSSAALSSDGKLAFIAYIDHYNGIVKTIHHDANGWGSPYAVGKVSSVSSFAEMVNAAADNNGQGRVMRKTKGGMVQLVSDWRP